MKLFSKTTLRFLFLSLLVMVLCVPFAQAEAQTVEDNGLSMTIRPGFDGIIKDESWFPVLITLANDGPAVEGKIELSVSNSGTMWVENVSLPTQSRKQIQTVVHAAEFASGLRAVLKDDEGNRLLTFASTTTSLKTLDYQEALIYGVVSQEPDTLELLSKVSGSRSDAAVAYLSIEEIPVDPIAMEGLDVLIFSDTDTNALSAAQRETISSWVKQGGQLVLTGGAGWQKTTAAFQDVLPVEILGTESADDLLSLESAIGVPFRDPGPYILTQSSLKSGELVWRNDAQPVLARRAEGAGNVWFLALDPQFAPLDDWDGSLVVWDSVAQFVPRTLFWERGFVNRSSLVDAVSTIPAIQLPSVWLILGFMALYILIVGPLNYIVLSRMERRELAWLTLPITILLFSGVALLVGLQFRGNRVIINQLSVVSGRVDAPDLRVESGVGVYSPRRDEFDITFESNTHLNFFDRFGGTGFSDSPQVTLGNENLLEDVLVSVGDVTPITSSSYKGVSPISASVILSADGEDVTVTITNESPDTLYNILLMLGSKHIQVKDLRSGQTFEREIGIPFGNKEDFAAEAAGGPERYRLYTGLTSSYQDHPLENGFSTLVAGDTPGGSYRYYDDPERSQRNYLLNSLYENYDSDDVYLPDGKVIFIGWSDVSQFDISLSDNRFDLEASSLYFIEIPVEK